MHMLPYSLKHVTHARVWACSNKVIGGSQNVVAKTDFGNSKCCGKSLTFVTMTHVWQKYTLCHYTILILCIEHCYTCLTPKRYYYETIVSDRNLMFGTKVLHSDVLTAHPLLSMQKPRDHRANTRSRPQYQYCRGPPPELISCVSFKLVMLHREWWLRCTVGRPLQNPPP